MRIVFMGTPSFATVVLEELAHKQDVVGVYTRPDAIRKRGKELVASPVKQTARRLDLPVFTPLSLCDPGEVSVLAALKPDIVCVAAYGAILPSDVLDLAPFGCVNVHASLLPRWRGAAPIERAILAGDEQVGVCIMKIVEKLDAGPFCAARSIPADGRYLGELTDELADLGAHALITALADIEQGKAYWVEQDERLVTYAPKIAKGELNPDPNVSAIDNVRRVRASSDAHPARCLIADRCVRLIAAREIASEGIVGNAVFRNGRLILMCKQGAFEVQELKPDGKRHMDAASFVAGLAALRGETPVMWGCVRG